MPRLGKPNLVLSVLEGVTLRQSRLGGRPDVRPATTKPTRKASTTTFDARSATQRRPGSIGGAEAPTNHRPIQEGETGRTCCAPHWSPPLGPSVSGRRAIDFDRGDPYRWAAGDATVRVLLGNTIGSPPFCGLPPRDHIKGHTQSCQAIVRHFGGKFSAQPPAPTAATAARPPAPAPTFCPRRPAR